jgi:hypothetical protein
VTTDSSAVIEDGSRPPVLDEAEAGRRGSLLTELHEMLAAQGVRSILARNHRLVLRYDKTPYEPSGPTDPALHIFTSEGTTIATTDGTAYVFTTGQRSAADDPAAAVALISRSDRATTLP